MLCLNFLVLFLQELRSFLGGHFGIQSSSLVYAVLGFQFLLFFVDVSFDGFSIPKIALLMLIFAPLYLFNKLALHCVFILMNIINVRNLTLKQLVRYVLVIQIVFTILSFALLGTGMVHDTVWNMPKGSAHTLGFRNPNGTRFFLTNTFLFLSFYLVVFDKPLALNFLLLVPIYVIYKLTYGRTYFIGAVVYYLFLFLFRARFFYKHNYWLYTLAPILLGYLLFLGIRLYEAYPVLDLLFSLRLSMSKQVLDEFSSVHYILGSSYVPEGITVDSSYLFLVCEAGVFSVGLFMLLYVKFVKKISPSEAKFFFPFVFFMLVAGVTEITFPAFSASAAIFYKILYQTAARKKRLEVSRV